MTIREHIRYLTDIRDNIQQAIDAAKLKCSHDQFFVGMYSHRPGNMDPQRICYDCGDVLAGITASESLQAWENFGIKKSEIK